jgi:hypothetical protein
MDGIGAKIGSRGATLWLHVTFLQVLSARHRSSTSTTPRGRSQG